MGLRVEMLKEVQLGSTGNCSTMKQGASDCGEVKQRLNAAQYQQYFFYWVGILLVSRDPIQYLFILINYTLYEETPFQYGLCLSINFPKFSSPGRKILFSFHFKILLFKPSDLGLHNSAEIHKMAFVTD